MDDDPDFRWGRLAAFFVVLPLGVVLVLYGMWQEQLAFAGVGASLIVFALVYPKLEGKFWFGGGVLPMLRGELRRRRDERRQRRRPR